MNPRRRRTNRQRRLDRAAVLRVAAQSGIDRETALNAFARGSVQVIPVTGLQADLASRFVVGRWGI